MTEGYISDNEFIETKTPAKNYNFSYHLAKYLREYSEVTSIQGLRYLGEKRSSKVEKVIWTLIILLSLAGCLYMIYGILNKYNESPVVVSFSSESTPIYDIPFPSVTICPEAKSSRKKFDFGYSLDNYQFLPVDEFHKLLYMSILCNQVDQPSIFWPEENKTYENEFFDVIDEIKPSDVFMDESLSTCNFMGNNFHPCSKILRPIITDEGICYTFNILDREQIFREHVVHYKDFHDIPFHNSYSEFGYDKEADILTYPRRVLLAGADHSLKIVLEAKPEDYDYKCTEYLKGFRVLLHNSMEIPLLSRNYFRVPPDGVVVASVEPDFITTSEAVRAFSPEKRKCYTWKERPLKHFKIYTESNCLTECLTNYTLNKCGCVAFYMPRDNKTKICGLGSMTCYVSAKTEVTIQGLEKKIYGSQVEDDCDCKPSCTELKYKIELSNSPTTPVMTIQKSVSALYVYFKNDKFIKIERNELYGISDFISNLGGLLGLFTGFSIMSLVEIIYFLTLRLYYNIRIYGIWSGAPEGAAL